MHKTIVVAFEGEEETAYVEFVGEDFMELRVFGEMEFHAELYFDDWPDWYIVEIKD